MGYVWARYEGTRPGYMQVDLGRMLAVSEEEFDSKIYEAPASFDITRDTTYQVDLGYTI